LSRFASRRRVSNPRQAETVEEFLIIRVRRGPETKLGWTRAQMDIHRVIIALTGKEWEQRQKARPERIPVDGGGERREDSHKR